MTVNTDSFNENYVIPQVMIPGLPAQISQVFILTSIICFILFYRAVNYNPFAAVTFISLVLIQGMLAGTGFYSPAEKNATRLLLLILPAKIVCGKKL